MTTTVEQLDLITEPTYSANPEVAWLERILFNAHGWFTAKEILSLAGSAPSEQNKRRLRDLASESPDIISGNRGYCHARHASNDDKAHCANRLDSQADKMHTRATAIRRHLKP